MLTSFPTDFFSPLFFEKLFCFTLEGGREKSFAPLSPEAKGKRKKLLFVGGGGGRGKGGDFLEVADSAAARVEETEVHL